ncbi:unnamed protein product [Victoria cruziana]
MLCEEVGGRRMKWEVVLVPGKLPASDRETCVNVFAATIKAKLANTFVRQLNQVAPLENLRHVKRVRRSAVDGNIQLTVILCQPREQGDQLPEMPNDVVELIDMHKLHPFIVRVPKYAALTKEEWEKQCKIWPTSYHPHIENRDRTSGLDEEETEIVASFMRLTIQLAKSGSYRNKVINTAVIVDPLVRQVISSGCDQTCSMTVLSTKCTSEQSQFQATTDVEHCQLHALDSGTTKLSSCDLNGAARPCASVSCLNPWGWVNEQAHAPDSSLKIESHFSWHPLRHAALVAIELAAARDRDLFPGGRTIDKDDLEIPANLTAKRQKRDSSIDDSPVIATAEDATALTNGCAPSETVGVTPRPYLCTGFDAYLLWEPCCLCAMALLHQRVKRIFFAFPNLGAGALGSVHRLHGEKNLNHHYTVFRVMVPKDVLAET